VLQFNEVYKQFQSPNQQTVHPCKDLTLEVNAGEFVGVQGASGCGKTTMLLIAGGLLSPDSGSVQIDGKNPYELSGDQRARFRASKIGFVFQQFHLVPYLNVLENVLAASIGVDPKQKKERADELIETFGLRERAMHLPGKLSTGERQRTALARALFNRPRLLLADEPTGNLDESNSQTVLAHLTQFVEDGGAALMVSHDSSALQSAQRVLEIRQGQIVTPPLETEPIQQG